MKSEKRNHQRLKPKGLQAGVTFYSEIPETVLDAEILDISYSGIRVKLKEPIACNINGPIKITMKLPDSGLPFSVHGILKHQHSDLECGVHYVDHVEGSIDDLMFECIDLDSSTVLIKTL
jgi:hypothetical protein